MEEGLSLLAEALAEIGTVATVLIALTVLALLGPAVGMILYRGGRDQRSFVVGAFLGSSIASLLLAAYVSSPPFVVVVGVGSVYGVCLGLLVAYVAPFVRDEVARQGARR